MDKNESTKTRDDEQGARPLDDQASAQKTGEVLTKRRRLRPRVALVAVLLVAVAALLVWYFFLRAPAAPRGVIQVSGRIEGDDAAVASKASGRIREITVREGDRVTAGQTIAVIDDESLQARVEQARFAVEQAEARAARAREQIAVLQSQLEQARLTIEQSREDARGRVRQAEAQVAQAEAQLAQAEAAFAQARYDDERFARLAKTGDVSERSERQAHAAAESQAAVVRAARRQVEVARGGLIAARASLTNPAIRIEQANTVERQIAQADTDVRGALADAERARAQLRETEATQADLTIVAPFDATVATRAAEPGEVVAAGTTIVTLVNFDQIYLRAFVPEGEIGRVRTGQAARVYLDSDPKRPLEAIVARIDPEASFTPENTYFRDDRVKQVFGVRLQLTDPQGFAKPGMPADGEILVEGDNWPASKRQ